LLFTRVASFGATPFVVDDFKDVDLRFNPEWFQFGSSPILAADEGATYAGSSNSWFVQGLGTYLGVDMSPFSEIEVLIAGHGALSGRLKIELYDDDNNNWKLEQDVKRNFEPMYDDRFVYEIDVTWTGQKTVTIPLRKFRDNNPKVGNNYFDANQKGGSGGLLQIQLIGLTPRFREKGSLHFQIQKISFL